LKLIVRRREAEAALARVRRSEHAWEQRTRVLRAFCARHRAALIVGGGFATGLVTSLLPVRPLLRLGSAFVSTATLMFKGPLSRIFAEQYRSTFGDRDQPAGAPE